MENISIVDKFGCFNIFLINQIFCKGFCSLSVVVNVILLWIYVDCFCCKFKNFRVMSVFMRCLDGGVKVFNYFIIIKCGCEVCESYGYEMKLRFLVGIMFGNVIKEIDDEIVYQLCSRCEVGSVRVVLRKIY